MDNTYSLYEITHDVIVSVKHVEMIYESLLVFSHERKLTRI